MNYGVLLAGGSGTRLKSASIPKQFIVLGNASLLEHAVDKFLVANCIDKIVVVVPEIWLSHAQDLLKAEIYKDVLICTGGKTRQESLYKGLKFLASKFDITTRDKVVSHDVARPFVTLRIIEDNIKALDSFDAVDTVIPATDTIVNSIDHESVTSIPNRADMYQGQTPQSFYLNDYIQLFESLTKEYLDVVTDAARIFAEHGKKVGLVKGEEFNIKITTDYDLSIANYLLGNKSNV